MSFDQTITLFAGYSLLFLVIALAFKAYISWKIGGQQKKILLAIGLFTFLSSLLVIREFNHQFWSKELNVTLGYLLYGYKTVWWYCIGVIFSNSLDYFIWNGIMRRGEDTVIHKYIIQFTDFVIYFFISLLVYKIVFEQSLAGLFISSGVLAIILGLSAQTTLGGVFSGLSLSLNDSFKKGDYIITDKVRGYIQDMNWHSVTIIDRHLQCVIIPNKTIDDAPIINVFKKNEYRMLEIKILAQYDVPPELVKRLMLETASHSSYAFLEPRVLVRGYGLNGIEYVLELFTKVPEDSLILNDFYSLIWYKFKEHHVSFKPSSYQYENPDKYISEDSYLKPLSTSDKAQIISGLELFSILNEEELQYLAFNSSIIITAPPDRITVQGEAGDSLFVVIKGTLGVFVKQGDTAPQKVAQLGKGQVFGEMALLTGEARTATVKPLDEVLVLEVTKQNLLPILENRQEIADFMSAQMAERIYKTQESLKNLPHVQQQEEIQHIRKKLKSLIGAFFKKA